MPLRRTKRSDGLTRSGWKGGSHDQVENTNAKESRPDEIAFEANLQTEPLGTAPYLFHRSHEPKVSTRDCRPRREQAPGSKNSRRMGKNVLRSNPMEGIEDGDL